MRSKPDKAFYGSAIRKVYFIKAFLVAFLISSCATTDRSANVLGSYWRYGTPVAAGLVQSDLEQLSDDIRAGKLGNTHAVLVEYDGRLVYEDYFEGTDQAWGTPLGNRRFNASSLHDVRSISKSITSILLGQALQSGGVSHVHEPVSSFLPELKAVENANAVTLHQLMTMTSGLQWNEMDVPYNATNDEIVLYGQRNPAQYVMQRNLVSEPGENWYYNGGVAQVMATIVTAKTGKSLDEFAHEALFQPLGINQFEWRGPGGWSPDNPAAMSGLRLTARDLAKIGSLILHNGSWRGKQIVPKDWVKQSTQRLIKDAGTWSGDGLWGYGYQWWVADWHSGERIISAQGNGNSRLYVIPEEKLVVTVLAGDYNNWSLNSETILQRILDAR